MYLVAWENIYRPKLERGLAIRKTQDINASKTSKLGWKILTEKTIFGEKTLGTNI